jgi:hypothetical protein
MTRSLLFLVAACSMCATAAFALLSLPAAWNLADDAVSRIVWVSIGCALSVVLGLVSGLIVPPRSDIARAASVIGPSGALLAEALLLLTFVSGFAWQIGSGLLHAVGD